MSGTARKLSPLEQKLHQAALADPQKAITQKECDTLIPDPSARLAAINFLLGTGLWKALKDTSGNLSYRVVTKKELEVKKDMSGEEGMILSYIQSAGNEGIWTKHLKAKTELHQTVIDRCLKSLGHKQLIKAVKSVKYPTRKIYMLFHLEPSVEMTGGPWYTDNELDTEFIKLLCSACLRFILDRSTPKHKGVELGSSADRPLYPISAAPAYPTAQQVLTFLSKSRITETQLATEHVEMLLNVLIMDGEIERVPAFGAAMWDAAEAAATGASGSEDEDSRRSAKEREKERKKRKRREREDSDSPKRDRKRSKRSRSSSGSESESDSEDSEEERERRRKKEKKRKSRSRVVSSDEDNDADEKESRKRKKKRSRENSAEDVERSDAERKSKSKIKKRKKSRRYSSDESGSDSDDNSDDDSDDDRRSRSKSKSKSKSKRKRSPSPAGEEDVTASLLGQDYGAYVYRAVRQERVGGGGGGLAQTPCVRCPVFDFCKDGGPVNPQECEYYGTWLVAADVAKD